MKKYLVTGAVLALAIVVGALSFQGKARADISCGSGCNITGWIWSSNVGWMSLSSTTPVNYGLTIVPQFQQQQGGGSEQSNAGQSNVAAPGQLALNGGGNGPDDIGYINGYVWSDHIGWIQFGNSLDLTGVPSGDGTVATQATVDFTTGRVTGWARALSALRGSPGWDGWISLSGTHNPSPNLGGAGGVTMNPSTGAITGYAWGGTVLGWMVFSGACAGGSNGCGNTNQVLTGTCTANGSTQTVILPSGGGSVTYKATEQGGQGSSYRFLWSNPSSDQTVSANSTQVSQSYSTPGLAPVASVVITDNLTTYQSNPIVCPSVVVASPGQAMKLSIGSPTATSLWPLNSGDSMTYPINDFRAKNTRSYYAINAGQSFQLQWDIDLSFDFTECSATGSNGSNLLSYSEIKPKFYDNDFGTPTSGYVRPIGTTGGTDKLATGVYTFTLTCDVDGANSQTSSVKLDVTSTSEGEH